MQDLRFALRMLLRNPGFSAMAVLTLALGIAANTAIFSVVDAVLFRPLPYRAPGELIHVAEQSSDAPTNFSWPDYIDVRGARSLASSALYKSDTMVLGGGDRPRQIQIGMVTPDFLSVLGIEPVLGRGFTAEDGVPGAARTVILGQRIWREAFGADPTLVGRTVLLDTRSHTVVAIAPAGLDLPRDVEVWIPLIPSAEATQARSGHSMGRMIARLAPGASFEAARAELDALARGIGERLHPPIAVTGAQVVPLEDELVGRVRPALLVLLVAVAFVLLIACVNVANLLLVRAAARRRELALRVALGASRWRLVRQLLLESMVLAAVAGTIGVLLAAWSTDLLIWLGAANLPRIAGAGLSGRVLVATLAIIAGTGLGCGLVPALRISRLAPNDGLKEGGRGITDRGMARTRQILVAVEVALALVLLVGAALLLDSFARVVRVPTGYEPDKLFTVKTSLPGAKYRTPADLLRFADALLARLESVPGIPAAALADIPPLSTNYNQMGTVIEGEAPRSEHPSYDLAAVTPGYFRTMGIAVRNGRDFGRLDGPDAPPVAVVDTLMAERMGGDPIGRRIRLGSETQPWRTVVGVAASVKQSRRDLPTRPQIYVPLAQRPSWEMTMLLRSGLPPAQLAAAAAAAVRAVDPGQPVYDERTMDELLGQSVAERRFTMLLVLIFGSAALALAGMGIYGMVAFATSTRLHEIAIRVSLGARARDVVRLVVGQGMRPVVVGVIAGTAGALAAARAIAGLLFDTRAGEPLVYAGVAGFLVVVALAAAWLPARRAARLDPMAALRSE